MGEIPSKEVEKRLKQADWDSLIPKLVIYTRNRMSFIRWPGGHPPGNCKPEDVTFDAIGSIYIGERQWNPDEHPDLEMVLKGIIKSKINGLVQLKDTKTRQSLSDNPGVDDWSHNVHSLSPPQEDNLQAKELFGRIESVLEGDEDAGMVLLCIEEGYTKPREIAEQLGISVSDANNILRRIRRKTLGIMDSIE